MTYVEQQPTREITCGLEGWSSSNPHHPALTRGGGGDRIPNPAFTQGDTPSSLYWRDTPHQTGWNTFIQGGTLPHPEMGYFSPIRLDVGNPPPPPPTLHPEMGYFSSSGWMEVTPPPPPPPHPEMAYLSSGWMGVPPPQSGLDLGTPPPPPVSRQTFPGINITFPCTSYAVSNKACVTKWKIFEILRSYGFKMLNMEDTCASPGFIETFSKDGKLQIFWFISFGLWQSFLFSGKTKETYGPIHSKRRRKWKGSKNSRKRLKNLNDKHQRKFPLSLDVNKPLVWMSSRTGKVSVRDIQHVIRSLFLSIPVNRRADTTKNIVLPRTSSAFHKAKGSRLHGRTPIDSYVNSSGQGTQLSMEVWPWNREPLALWNALLVRGLRIKPKTSQIKIKRFSFYISAYSLGFTLSWFHNTISFHQLRWCGLPRIERDLYIAGGTHAFLRGYQQGLITLDIHEYVEENQESFLNDETGEELKSKIKGSLMSVKCKRWEKRNIVLCEWQM